LTLQGADGLTFSGYLLSKGSLPKDIIKSNEGASLMICQQVLSIIVRKAGLRFINRTISPMTVGRLPCGDNFVPALDSKDL